MIKYQLTCTTGHEFEGWFQSSSAFDAQSQLGRVTCPDCGSSDVSKAVMAPSVATRAEVLDKGGALPPSENKRQEFLQMARAVRQKLVAGAEDVGDRFPEEARKIHYEEAADRKIYGEASTEEARSLLEEGIEVVPLPRLPEDGN